MRDPDVVDGLAAGLRGILGPDAVRKHQPLAQYTALRVGGTADLLVVTGTAEELRQVATTVWDYGQPYTVLGGGSNVLVSDAGVRGLVVLNRARAVTFSGTEVRAESGASLSTVAQQCVRRGLAGLEWAAGIPGTVGGAVVGNAGAWGGDIASTLTQATIYQAPGVLCQWPAGRFEYGYRTSILKERPTDSRQEVVVLEAEFALQAGEREALEAKVAGITAKRRASQPPGATCGSVFKNPPGDYAGRLIEAAGLKGMRSGDAQISPLHANFVINHGGATASDVKRLIDIAHKRVREHFGVSLELEIELAGDW